MTPEVEELVKSGKLHEFDAQWIMWLQPDQQMAAALKCMRNFNVTMTAEDNPKSRIVQRVSIHREG